MQRSGIVKWQRSCAFGLYTYECPCPPRRLWQQRLAPFSRPNSISSSTRLIVTWSPGRQCHLLRATFPTRLAPPSPPSQTQETMTFASTVSSKATRLTSRARDTSTIFSRDSNYEHGQVCNCVFWKSAVEVEAHPLSLRSTRTCWFWV